MQRYLRKMAAQLSIVCLSFNLTIQVSAAADNGQTEAGSSRMRAAQSDNVERRSVVIWSDGTRMAGDLYRPKNLAAGDKLPAVIFCNGMGGTKEGTGTRLGPLYVERGFIFLAFDYRGWGKSDCKLFMLGDMPAPDEKGELVVRAKPIRWQLDFADQTYDILSAISFLSGEPNVDPNRIGIVGSSYGGGLVTWVAGNDPRVKCLVAQVPGMGGGRGPAALNARYSLATKQARGETEPVPLTTGKPQGKLARFDQMHANPSKSIGYSAIEAANKIDIPTLIVVAENDELIDNNNNGKKVYDTIKSKGNVPVAYEVMSNMGHFDVYRKGFPQASDLELKWFQEHLQKNQ
jgi:uncharacterized protein